MSQLLKIKTFINRNQWSTSNLDHLEFILALKTTSY